MIGCGETIVGGLVGWRRRAPRARAEAEPLVSAETRRAETPKMGRRGRPRDAGGTRVPAPHPPGASAAAPANPAHPNVAAHAKAKAVLQKQKELAAKLASVPKLANPAAAPSGADAARKTALARALEVAAAAKSAKPAAATASAAPRALRLNAAGGGSTRTVTSSSRKSAGCPVQGEREDE